MIDLSVIIGAATPIREWFELIRTGRKQKSQKDEEALAALLLALNETRIYIGSLDRHRMGLNLSTNGPTHSRDERTEAMLSRLWTTASLKLRHVDPDLSERCFRKGEYWANPDEWAGDDIKKGQCTAVYSSLCKWPWVNQVASSRQT
jgi:hypothetical protein